MNDIIKSAGAVIIKNNKLLLCHPTGAKWYGTYSIPKGLIEIGEDIISAIIRETKEEIGVNISEYVANNNNDIHIINYTPNNKTQSVVTPYKQIYYIIIKVSDNDKNFPDIISREHIQLAEVDWVGFVDYKNASKRIFHKQKELLKLII